MLSFQQIILELQTYWDRQGCALLQPYDMEVGAGTSHTATFLRALGPEPWKAAYVQPSRRPKDGRYGENPNRLQHYYQYQVVLKPAPANILDLYLGSLEALGFDLTTNDVRFVEDDWENPTLGCWGLGWEVWLNGMEVTQFTYFQQVGGIECRPITGEITYGLERLAMYIQGVESLFDLTWAPGISYRDVYHQNEVEQSAYNFEHSDVEFLLLAFGKHEQQAVALMQRQLALPAYEQVLKAAHTFNLLDARGAISVTERAAYIGRIRHLARSVAQSYLDSRARLGFPMAPKAWADEVVAQLAAKTKGDGAGARGCARRAKGSPVSASTKNLLVELRVEELPPKALRRLGEAFAHELAASLKAQGLAGEHASVTAFATPRRLAARVSGVLTVATDREVVRKVMPVAVALDKANQPTPALRKALAKLGREQLADKWPDAVDGSDGLFVQPDGKTDAIFLRSLERGSTLAAGLQLALDHTLDRLPIPKLMTYQLADGWSGVRFVRPAHGLVVLHGADVVPVCALGLQAGRETKGHRFEAAMDPVNLQDADQYERQLLDQGGVIAGFEHRRAEVARQLQHAAHEQGLKAVDDDALLDEVTALVERPNVLRCRFDEAFLAVPPECLILTMKANQKYFPLLDRDGRLTNQFLVVSNIRPADPGAVIQGNERVVRPRLADAKFFFDQDRRRSLESRLPGLDKVVYHAKLGSMGERVARVRSLAHAIGQQLRGTALAAQADRAAQLAKADLLTDMVGEFPELQGVMGGYYARHDGENEAVAFAIEDHYKPRFAGDALPRNEVGLAVALADKLETLAGLFGIGQLPTGDKDPFALRRHALGVIRMLIERDLPLAVPDLVVLAAKACGTDAQAAEALTGFVYDRLVGYLRELGYSAQEVDAVVSVRPPRWGELPQRLAAVRAFAALAESPSLAAANKRIGNILKKSDAAPAATVDPSRLVEPAERALAEAMRTVLPRADAHYDDGRYTESLRELAALKAPVDAFFDSVMVNADDAALRANRLALLASLHHAMNRVADLSRLAG